MWFKLWTLCAYYRWQGSLKEQNWYLWVLTEWLTGYGLDSPTMDVSWWKDQKSCGGLVHLNECLSSPNLVFRHKEFMRTTGLQPLLGSRSSFSHQQRNAMPAGDKLASQSEVSRQIAKAFFFFLYNFMWAATRRYGLPTLNGEWGKFLAALLSFLGFSWLLKWSSWPVRLATEVL